MARAVSTVLDVSICLLLVGVAVTTLAVSVPGDEQPPTVDAGTTATELGTVTTSVSATPDDRQVHDTLAGHLAAAAIANGSVDGERLGSATYPEAVRREIEDHVDERTHVTVRWQPYHDAPVEGQLTAGSEPPSTADVAVARWTINSGMLPSESVVSFEAIATSLSTAYIDRLFPPEETRVALVDSRKAEPTAARYRAAAETLGIDIEAELVDADTGRANERLASTLAGRFEADFRDTYRTPAEAADDEQLGSVELVIRRWEP